MAEELANNLLRRLRPDDSNVIEPLLQAWAGNHGDVIYEPGDEVRHVYFPCGPALVSFMVILPDGRAIETALVGREGAVGGIVSQGRLPAYSRSRVQFSGPFLRLEISELETAKSRSASVRSLFARYADCLVAQIFQSVACNAAHTIEQRTAKWLLAAIDRTGGDEVPQTQEQLAEILGVGRSYISRVIQTLKHDRVIETRRGGLKLHDFRRLQALSCGCNDAVRRHFDDVLSGVYPVDDENTAEAKPSGRTKKGKAK